MKKYATLLWGIFLLLVFSSCLTTGSVRSVSIEGTGSVRAVPDRADFDLTFTESAQTTAQARDLVNEKIIVALNYLAGAGIGETSIKTSRLSYRKNTRWFEGEEIFIGQEASQVLHVTMDLEGDGLNSLIDQLTQIDGLGLGNLYFSQKERALLLQKARELAYQDALEKAEDYARFSQHTLKGLISLSENQSFTQNGPFYAMEVQRMDKSSSSVMAGENEIIITVFTVFELR